MTYKKFIQIWSRFNITKRQKFVIIVVILSLLLFLSENLFGKSGIYIVFFISFLTGAFLFWAVREDLKDNFSPQVFILPFLYSLAFGLFYFLFPSRFLTRAIMTSFYALGLYSLLLSLNIFIVSSIRTIALLSSARTVSFVMTLVTYLFLSNVIFSLHGNVFLTTLLVFLLSFPLVLQSLWAQTLDKRLFSHGFWALSLTICLVEISIILWFWPLIPIINALFLTGFFYIIVGLSHVWVQKRLFKNIMWEYIWVGVLVFTIFIFFVLKEE